jgi:hypothetical protein
MYTLSIKQSPCQASAPAGFFSNRPTNTRAAGMAGLKASAKGAAPDVVCVSLRFKLSHRGVQKRKNHNILVQDETLRWPRGC